MFLTIRKRILKTRTKGSLKMNIIENLYEKKFNNFSVKVKMGDLTKEKVDAVIVPEYYRFSERDGLANAIIRSNGNAKSFDDYDEIAGSTNLYLGDSVVTDSYSELYKKIIHTVTVLPTQPYHDEKSMVHTAVYNAIMEGRKLGLKSFAFPTLNTGIGGGLDFKTSASSIFHGFASALNKMQENKDNEKVSASVVLMNKETLNVFKEELSYYKQGENGFVFDSRYGSVTLISFLIISLFILIS